uniref:Venom peptide U-reduvitoxin-Pp19 n=1 Tax=Pristhesancus plagipennis TaxID=1955184 RepID=TX19A_PRIPG|nr:venom peptide Pp19a [Pristhesancus plagipennis]
MSPYSILFVVVIALCLLPESIVGVCWDTGCQLNAWAVRGCAQYGMRDVNMKSCSGGIIYTCCD